MLTTPFRKPTSSERVVSTFLPDHRGGTGLDDPGRRPVLRLCRGPSGQEACATPRKSGSSTCCAGMSDTRRPAKALGGIFSRDPARIRSNGHGRPSPTARARHLRQHATAMLDRRTFLAAGGAAAAFAALGTNETAFAATGLKLGQPPLFLRTPRSAGRIAGGAALSCQCQRRRPPCSIASTTRRTGRSASTPTAPCFATGPGAFPVTFFHLGRFFPNPVRMHLLETAASDSFAREILYDPGYFDMPADSPARKLPPGAGFAGFRFQESRQGDPKQLDWRKNDWVAFLGASYFRAIGELYQYGLSARGIAIDVAEAGPARGISRLHPFLLRAVGDGSDSVTVHALLEGPSLTGAYRFVMERDEGRAHGGGMPALPASRRGAAGHRAADLDVLVLRNAPSAASTGARGARFGRPRDVERQRRTHLAPAQQPRADHGLGLRRYPAARLRPAAARPRLRRTTWMACTTSSAPACGSSRSATGATARCS
jgi:hypothetical protein